MQHQAQSPQQAPSTASTGVWFFTGQHWQTPSGEIAPALPVELQALFDPVASPNAAGRAGDDRLVPLFACRLPAPDWNLIRRAVESGDERQPDLKLKIAQARKYLARMLPS